jgi:hypothetical protein
LPGQTTARFKSTRSDDAEHGAARHDQKSLPNSLEEGKVAETFRERICAGCARDSSTLEEGARVLERNRRRGACFQCPACGRLKVRRPSVGTAVEN